MRDQKKYADYSYKHTLAHEAAVTRAKNQLTRIAERLTATRPVNESTKRPNITVKNSCPTR